MAAVLACRRLGGGGGDSAEPVLLHWGAAVSHRSAAVLWELLPERNGPVDVSVPGNGGKKRRSGVRLHRFLTLSPASVTLRGGVPVTTAARTITDLRRSVAARWPEVASAKELRRAIRQAELLGLPLGFDVEPDRTRSDLERDFLRLCRRHRLPAPDVNERVGRDLVDFLWREQRLIVETDGYRYHRGRVAFQDDRDRDLRLRELGFEVVRISEKQIDEKPQRIADAVRAALSVHAGTRPVGS